MEKIVGFTYPLCLILAFLVGVWVVTDAQAQSKSTKLPGAVSSRVKQVRSALDQVEKALDAGRLTTAQGRLAEAQRAMKEIQDRYAGKFSADDPEYKATADRLAAVAKKVEEAAGAAQASADQGKAAKEQTEALCKPWVEKLAPFVDHRSESYLRMGSDLNTASAADQAKSRAAYVKAKALWAEYQQAKFPGGKTQQLESVESSLAGVIKYYEREEAGDTKKNACREWVAQIAPFVDVGTGSQKLLIASPTADVEQMKQQQALYEEAKALWEKYQKAGFPEGRTQRLDDLEKALKQRLEEFPKAMAQSRAMVSGDVGKRMEAVLAYLEKDKEWQSDKAKKPPIVMERDLQPLREELTRMAGAGDEGKLAELKGKLKAIEDKNAEYRRIRAERTFQTPDRYKGDDLEQVKAKALEVLKAQHADAKVHRTTVTSQDWAVEDVIEATDTTKTVFRLRITRSVRAQLAVKMADGKVYLQEVYLGQDKQSDGAWGALKGHTTWADWMAEENVGKDAP